MAGKEDPRDYLEALIDLIADEAKRCIRDVKNVEKGDAWRREEYGYFWFSAGQEVGEMAGVTDRHSRDAEDGWDIVMEAADVLAYLAMATDKFVGEMPIQGDVPTKRSE